MAERRESEGRRSGPLDARYAPLYEHVLYDTSLTTGARVMFAALCDYWNPRDGYAWPSRHHLSKRLGKSVRRVDAMLRELEDNDLIVVERVSGKGNRYRISPPPPATSDTGVGNDTGVVSEMTPGVAESCTPPLLKAAPNKHLVETPSYATSLTTPTAGLAVDESGFKGQERVATKELLSESPNPSPLDAIPMAPGLGIVTGAEEPAPKVSEVSSGASDISAAKASAIAEMRSRLTGDSGKRLIQTRDGLLDTWRRYSGGSPVPSVPPSQSSERAGQPRDGAGTEADSETRPTPDLHIKSPRDAGTLGTQGCLEPATDDAHRPETCVVCGRPLLIVEPGRNTCSACSFGDDAYEEES